MISSVGNSRSRSASLRLNESAPTDRRLSMPLVLEIEEFRTQRSEVMPVSPRNSWRCCSLRAHSMRTRPSTSTSDGAFVATNASTPPPTRLPLKWVQPGGSRAIGKNSPASAPGVHNWRVVPASILPASSLSILPASSRCSSGASKQPALRSTVVAIGRRTVLIAQEKFEICEPCCSSTSRPYGARSGRRTQATPAPRIDPPSRAPRHSNATFLTGRGVHHDPASHRHKTAPPRERLIQPPVA
jgi:hypothetical protein